MKLACAAQMMQLLTAMLQPAIHDLENLASGPQPHTS
jgi:hypothetical protein